MVQGYDPTTYGPDVDLDRAQIAVFGARAKRWVDIGDPMDTAPELFRDVPAGFWAGTAIEACVDNGVMDGDSDGYFHPTRIVTRAEMAVVVQRAFDLPM